MMITIKTSIICVQSDPKLISNLSKTQFVMNYKTDEKNQNNRKQYTNSLIIYIFLVAFTLLKITKINNIKRNNSEFYFVNCIQILSKQIKIKMKMIISMTIIKTKIVLIIYYDYNYFIASLSQGITTLFYILVFN